MIRRATICAALLGCLAIANGSSSLAAQSEQELQKRIAALEAGQQEILKELKELKTLLQQMRPPMAGQPPSAPTQPPQGTGGPLAQNAPKPPGPPPVPNFDLLLAGSPSKGNAAAKLVLLEFSDFECPFCGRYSRETHPQVIKEFVDSGKIRYVFRHSPIESLHPRALRAAEAAECAHAQGRFWDYHAKLFNSQQALTEPDLKAYAQAMSLNMPTFDQCMAAQLKNPAKIRQDQNEAGRAGLTGTPTFFIGTVTSDGKLKPLRRMVGAHPIANFRTTIETLLTETK